MSAISLHKNADILMTGASQHYYYDLAVLTLSQPLPEQYRSAIVEPVFSGGETSTNPVATSMRGARNPHRPTASTPTFSGGA